MPRTATIWDRPVEFGDGFSEWQGPNPLRDLPRLRWAVAPRSIIHVNVADAGRYWLEMLCLCSPTQRQFGVACDLRFIASRRLPAAKKQVTPTTVRIDLPLTIGSHEIELHFFNWQKKYGDSRLLAVGFTDVCLKRKFALVGKKSFFSNVFRRFRTRRKVF